tara:strand:- start:580 stop:879 length:300 start_codon:yes stop_codon:yes gene_type:complete
VQAIANKGWRRKTKLEVVDSLQSPRINVLMSIRSESMDARNFWRSKLKNSNIFENRTSAQLRRTYWTLENPPFGCNATQQYYIEKREQIKQELINRSAW